MGLVLMTVTTICKEQQTRGAGEPGAPRAWGSQDKWVHTSYRDGSLPTCSLAGNKDRGPLVRTSGLFWI